MYRTDLPAFFFLCLVMLLATAAVASAGPLGSPAAVPHAGLLMLPFGMGLVVVALLGRPPAPRFPMDDPPE